METCFLLGGMNVTTISVLSGPVVMMFTQIARDQGSIPHEGKEFFRIVLLIRPTITLRKVKNTEPETFLQICTYFTLAQPRLLKTFTQS